MDNNDPTTAALTAPAAPPPPAAPAAPAAAPAASPAAPATPAAPAAAPAAAAPATPAAPDQPGGIAGVMGSVLDMLSNRDRSTVSRDAQGNRVVTPAAPLTRGQQIAQIALTALKGATTAAAAPPGPGHMGRGVAAAVEQAVGDQQAAAHLKDEQADHDFAVKQKAKLDNVNYQLLTRQLAASEFDLKQRGVKASEDAINYSNTLLDREKNLGSYDLGVFKDEHDIPNVMAKQPAFMQKLYKEQGIIAVPVYNPSTGERQGVQVFERKPDTNAQLAPEGSIAHRWTLGSKPGEAPHMETFKPVGASNADIDRYNLKATNDSQAYEKEQSDKQLKAAQTAEANATAAAKPKEATARMIEAVASANKANAEARKARIEGDSESAGEGDGVGAGTSMEQQARMMYEGKLSPSQLSKRAKTYNELLPLANRISMQETGHPFDAEASEARFQGRKELWKGYANGAQADQIQSFNTFLGHALNLSSQVNQLRNTNSPFLNVPLKELRKQMGDDRYAQIQPLVYAVRKEYQNFLNKDHALHNDDIHEGTEMLNDTQSLAQMQGAMKSFGGAAVTRLGQTNDRYKRSEDVDVPHLLSPVSRQAIQHFGLDREARTVLGSAYTGQQPQQQPRQAPAADMVAVQIPGSPVGHIPRSALQKFQQDHPNAQVTQ